MVNQKLSSAEAYTWQVIQEHYDEIPQLSITDLAELAHCSLSTINRTVRKKGFSGYAEFRYSIKEKPLPNINGFSNELPWLSFSMAASNRFSLIRDDNS